MSKSLEEKIIKEFTKKYESFELGEPVNIKQYRLLKSFIKKTLAQYKREIIKEIKDDCFEVLFTKYLEHDDAVNATDDVLAELDKLNHTDKKEGGK